jgi:hypothetical protein
MALKLFSAVLFMFLSVDAALVSQVPPPVNDFQEQREQLNQTSSLDSNASFEEAHKIADEITVAGNVTTKPGSGEMTSTQLEAEMLRLSLGKGEFDATPLGGSVKKIREILVKTMMPKVKAAHVSDQTRLYKLKKDILKCGKTKDSGLRVASAELSKYRKQSKYHKKCRSDEAVKSLSKTNCLTQLKSKHTVKVLKCKNFAVVFQKWGQTKTNSVIIRKGGGESVLSYVTRLSQTFCGKHVHGKKGKVSRPGGWGGGLVDGALDQYLKAKDACEQATKEWKSKVKECKRKTRDYNVKKSQVQPVPRVDGWRFM